MPCFNTSAGQSVNEWRFDDAGVFRCWYNESARSIDSIVSQHKRTDGDIHDVARLHVGSYIHQCQN